MYRNFKIPSLIAQNIVHNDMNEVNQTFNEKQIEEKNQKGGGKKKKSQTRLFK